MCFLTYERNVVAHGFQRVFREVAVRDFGFLKTDKIRLMLGDDRLQLMQPLAQAVDIE